MSRHRRVWRRIGVTGTWLLAVLAVFVTVVAVLFYTLSDVPRPDDLPQKQVATITYTDGSPMAQIGVDRKPVALSQIPDAVRWAVIAAEDRGFYTEPGFSLKGTARAALNDVTGGDAQGGSGLTQQYVKNAYLNSERTLTRKLKELAISVKLARDYSKDQILEWYLNTVYFGRGAYGVETASEAYFGVSVDRLGPAQAALLAGLLRAPSYYDPAVNPEAAHDRWRYVVDAMVQTKHLDAAQATTLTFPTTVPDRSAQRAGSGPTGVLAQAVRRELAADGIDETTIDTRGLRIQTTIDRTAQADAIAAVTKAYVNPTAKQANLRQALVAVNPSTGGILAYYGGSDPTGNDYALAWRQPGSTFKPFALGALLSGTLAGTTDYTLDSTFPGSSPQTIDGQAVQNDPSENARGDYSLTQAMTISLNTVFYRVAALAQPSRVAAFAHAAGVSATHNGSPTLQKDGTTTPFVGIGSYEVTPVDMADAYATLANGGAQHPAYLVQKVTDAKGSVVFEHHDTAVRAMDPKVANDTTLSMEQVASSSGLQLTDGRTVAVKTGTVGIQGTLQASDAWTVGFTPQVSVASWAGADSGSDPIFDKSGQPMYGRENPGRAWQLFMDAYVGPQRVATMPSRAEVGVPEPDDSTSSSSAPATSSYAPPTRSTTPSPSTPTSRAPVSPPSPRPTPSPSPSAPATSSEPPPATRSSG